MVHYVSLKGANLVAKKTLHLGALSIFHYRKLGVQQLFFLSLQRVNLVIPFFGAPRANLLVEILSLLYHQSGLRNGFHKVLVNQVTKS